MRSEKREEELILPEIIHEDESMIVLSKPSGWITNSSETVKDQPTVQDWVRENFKGSAIESFEYRNGIVHRLDKETSGILLIAKTVEAMEELQRQFREREVQKKYCTLVHGEIADSSEKQEIDISVGRLPWNRRRFGVLPGGRNAVTFYQAQEHFEDKLKNKYTLVYAWPKTGRTHQIRIHMKHIGHPVVADNFYAGRKTSRNDRKWCPRLFLHAMEIEFTHPVSRESVSFEARLPEDLKKVLNNLQEIKI